MLTVRGLINAGLGPVSFELADGECLAVMGPSGVGKSLLLRAIADLDLSRGEVALDTMHRAEFSGPQWRREVVYVPAESGWWSERVGDHFPDWDAALPLVEALFLSAAVRDWSVQQLSTGERQRLALVRALTLVPRVLLLDEPTSGLDSNAAAAVERLVGERLRARVSVLWVTHDGNQAGRIAKRCLLLDEHGILEKSL